MVLEHFPYLLTKIVATALSVLGITLAADRFGSAVGGALSGLPVVVGPAMFFLYRDFGGEFTSLAAASSLMSLSATQVFLVVYCLWAARGAARGALTAAGASWLGTAFLLSLLPQSPLLGLLLFGTAAVCARLAIRPLVGALDASVERGPLSLRTVIFRSVAAGLLVACATFVADYLGPGWSGTIAAYPIGFSFVIGTLNLSFGRGTAIATSYAAMLGLSSLAAFAFTLCLAVPVLMVGSAFALALFSGMVATGAACWLARRVR